MSVQKYSYLKAWLGLGLDNVQTVISKIKRNECVPGKEYKLDIRVTDAPPLTTQPPWRWIIPVIFIHGECGRLKCFLCSCRKSQKVTMDIFEPGDENNEASHRAINSATRNQADPLHSWAGNEDFTITSRAPCWKCLLALSQWRHYMLNRDLSMVVHVKLGHQR